MTLHNLLVVALPDGCSAYLKDIMSDIDKKRTQSKSRTHLNHIETRHGLERQLLLKTPLSCETAGWRRLFDLSRNGLKKSIESSLTAAAMDKFKIRD
ncbi:hypothetical protein SD70_26840 [Gordoniibacillus kamchatkensis]|uniref:Uncharacterized protein n=1 Tax=Gordoniibacillus kamchatkensis TaxID=1590651 RepID=A0ABR5ABB6_9BACL|nr:hypothetical protein SD70_26840 [Paenibacillus sp. VKM B-2647]